MNADPVRRSTLLLALIRQFLDWQDLVEKKTDESLDRGILSGKPYTCAIPDALVELEDNIANESVTDDDVGFAHKYVIALDVADKVQAALLQQLVCFLGKFIALAFFASSAEHADGRVVYSENRSRIPVGVACSRHLRRDP